MPLKAMENNFSTRRICLIINFCQDFFPSGSKEPTTTSPTCCQPERVRQRRGREERERERGERAREQDRHRAMQTNKQLPRAASLSFRFFFLAAFANILRHLLLPLILLLLSYLLLLLLLFLRF